MRRDRVEVALLSVWFSLPAHGFDDQATSTADTGEGGTSRADADRWTMIAPESIEFPTDESAEFRERV